ncbi:hypothetical protein [Paenibacillus physcomitrellae]|uniref:Transmembrane protein n=1 Tax=Paenibacillus physcomitrellae TaxID=1619311 RepID=A0ABQ1GR01_9BACL|nr:hypothetical protein [Paenibacillus physcomitrellae]GGA48427.1 hypothetical protein GCM10010917_37170 [Paenibacillus physcomitrellae]
MRQRRLGFNPLRLLCLLALSFVLFLTPSHSAAAAAVSSFTWVHPIAETSDRTESEEMENSVQFRPVVRASLQHVLKDTLRFAAMFLLILSLLCSAYQALSLMAFRPIISGRIKRIMLHPVKFTSRFVV